MKHIEDAHQTMLFNWAKLFKMPDGRLLDDMLIAVPNGGLRNKREASRLKRQGVKAGFPDVFLFCPYNGYMGLAIELKRPLVKGMPKPQVRQNQHEWMARLQEYGYATVICYGFDEAKEAIENYFA